MKAQNLTISIPNKGCNKNCPYCVSKMTGYTETDEYLFRNNIGKVKRIADIANVSSVLITGKGEPFLNPEMLELVGREFHDYPLEIQTNGISGYILYKFYVSLFDVFAFSIDAYPWDFLEGKFNSVNQNNKIIRVTLNVINDNWLGHISLMDLIKECKKYKINQLSIRQITAPNNYINTEESLKAVKWINDHVDSALYNRLKEELENKEKRLIRILPYGTKVYDIDGISVTSFDYCVQDDNDGENIRSLIYEEDGHLYTSWNSKASILF